MSKTFNVKCINDKWLSTISGKKFPILGQTYKATHKFKSISSLFHIERDYINLEGFGLDSFTLDSFEIIPDNNIGERAPECDIIPSQTYIITRKEGYKSNHIF